MGIDWPKIVLDEQGHPVNLMNAATSKTKDRSGRGTSRVDMLTHLIADEIQADRIAHGTWLKQIELSERFGFNRITTRNALEKLVGRGMVEHFPNRGYRVRSVDAVRFRELLEIRMTIELSAVDSIIERASESDVKHLAALADTFASIVKTTGDFIALTDANAAFHNAVLALNANSQVPVFVKDLRTKMARGPNVKWRSLSSLEQSADEHLQMVKAIAGKEPSRLRELFRQHISSALL